MQQDGGFADAGVAPHQHGGSRHKATAQNPVQFRNAGDDARRGRAFALQANKFNAAPASSFGGGAGAARGGGFLDQRIPVATGIAAPLPFGADRPTGLANETAAILGHSGVHADQMILVRISPTPSTKPSSTSPRTTAATPSGVPVMMRSPGANSTSSDKLAMTSGTDQISLDRSEV